jgi:hypothetical protein
MLKGFWNRKEWFLEKGNWRIVINYWLEIHSARLVADYENYTAVK